MDIKGKRLVTGAQGSAAAEYRPSWYIKASSWQSGANTDDEAIRAESKENNLRFGVPDEDNVPAPGASNKDADATLPNPHNFSSNPGFMGTSTGSMLQMAAPRPGVGLGSGMRQPRGGGDIGTRPPSRPVGGGGGPVIGRRVFAGKGNIAMPAPGDTDPSSEGGPQVRSTGRAGA